MTLHGPITESIEVPSALDGERVDRAVSTVTGRSRAEVNDLIGSGSIRVNGTTVTVRHQRVAVGDNLQFDVTEVVERAQLRPASDPSVVFAVVYEDADLIVVDKPAGLVVHPGAGHRDDTLASGLIARFPDLVAAAEHGAGDPSRPGIVHRLDKDTSGLLVVARSPAAYASLVRQIASRSMGREYRALVLGMFENDEGTIEAPIGRSTRFPTKMTVHAGGRPARTRYLVAKRYDEPAPLTLLEVKLETGRTHQIRVHLSAIGHPIVGDSRYGGRTKQLVLHRPFLHAERLSLVHPSTEEPMEWTSPLPGDLVECLAALTEHHGRPG